MGEYSRRAGGLVAARASRESLAQRRSEVRISDRRASRFDTSDGSIQVHGPPQAPMSLLSAPSVGLRHLGLVATLALSCAACTDGPVAPRDLAASGRIDSVVTPAANVLSRWVFSTISGADSVWVEFAGTTDALQRSPAVSECGMIDAWI